MGGGGYVKREEKNICRTIKKKRSYSKMIEDIVAKKHSKKPVAGR